MEAGVQDLYHLINNISLNQLDNTYKIGSKAINLIAVTPDLFNLIKGCQLIETNELIITDHRLYISNRNIKQYFNKQMSIWDTINQVAIDPSR